MDENTRDLIYRMCVRAGMVMEDASPAALLGEGFNPTEISATLTMLAQASAKISALIAAASMLAGEDDDVS